MKKLLILFVMLLLISGYIDARIITVSNNQAIPAQFNLLQDALDSAAVGDTIYVHHSHISYGNIVIRKRIHLFGEGRMTYLQSIVLSSADGTSTNNCSGSVIKGFYIARNNTYDASVCQEASDATIISNLIFQRCFFESHFRFYNGNITRYHSSWLLRECVFAGNIYLGGLYYSDLYNQSNNMVFLNNLIYGYIHHSSAEHTFANNIFKGSSSYQAFNTVSNIIVENNIFNGPPPTGCSFCTFYNNLTSTNHTLPYGNNYGSNNIWNQSPLFVNANNYNFNWVDDYHLQSTSPAKNAGTDGRDLGIYGGAIPFPDDYTFYPDIPYIQYFNILNKVIGLNGYLIYDIKAKQK